VLFRLQRYEEASEAYDKVLKLDAEDAEAWHYKGRVARSEGRDEDALLCFTRALEIVPEYIGAAQERAAALWRLKRHAEAVPAYGRAIELGPSNASMWYYKGLSLSSLERHVEAIQAYDHAIELAFDATRAWYGKGHSLSKLGRYKEAIVAFDIVLSLKPEHVAAWTVKAFDCAKLGRHEEALAAVEHGLELEPENTDLWQRKAHALENLGRLEDALNAYDHLLSLNEGAADIWAEKARLLDRLQRYVETIAACDRALALEPSRVDAWTLRGGSLWNLKRHEEALAAYNRAIELKDDDAALWNNKAGTLEALGRTEEALASIEQAARLQPDNVRYARAIAQFLAALDRCEVAVAAYDKALSIDRTDAASWCGKILTLCKLDRFDEGLRTAEEAARLPPDSAQVQDMVRWVRRAAHRSVEDKGMRLGDGRWLAYVDFGDPEGTPVICCHGTPGSRLTYLDEEDVAKRLHLRLIAPDRPGYGLSDPQPRGTVLDWAGDVAELADHLGIERFAVLSVSGGGPYAAACAYKLPERVTRLTLVNSPAPFSAPGVWQAMSRLDHLRVRIARHTPRPVFDKMQDLFAWFWRRQPAQWYVASLRRYPQADRPKIEASMVTPTFLEEQVEPYRRSGAGHARDSKLMVRPWGFRLEDIRVETLVWHGELDTLAPPAMGRYLANAIPHCQVTFFPGEGHMVMHTHREEILGALAVATDEQQEN
jgi:tetratricopeptide (TPR) repeat protein/pimeloyl-ACP methyl ester carboxylesterase